MIVMLVPSGRYRRSVMQAALGFTLRIWLPRGYGQSSSGKEGCNLQHAWFTRMIFKDCQARWNIHPASVRTGLQDEGSVPGAMLTSTGNVHSCYRDDAATRFIVTSKSVAKVTRRVHPHGLITSLTGSYTANEAPSYGFLAFTVGVNVNNVKRALVLATATLLAHGLSPRSGQGSAHGLTPSTSPIFRHR